MPLSVAVNCCKMMRIVQCEPERHGEKILALLNDAILTSTALYDYKPRTSEMMTEWFNAKITGNFPVIGIENESSDLMGFGSYGIFRAWPAQVFDRALSLCRCPFSGPGHREAIAARTHYRRAGAKLSYSRSRYRHD
jgi:hypothetical protein